MTPHPPQAPRTSDQTGLPKPVRRFIFGFGWFTVAAAGAAMVVGSVAITLMSAWVKLGEAASDLNGPDTPTQPGPFFAAAFRESYGGITLASLLAVCGIVLFLVGGVQMLRRLFGSR